MKKILKMMMMVNLIFLKNIKDDFIPPPDIPPMNQNLNEIDIDHISPPPPIYFENNNENNENKTEGNNEDIDLPPPPPIEQLNEEKLKEENKGNKKNLVSRESFRTQIKNKTLNKVNKVEENKTKTPDSPKTAFFDNIMKNQSNEVEEEEEEKLEKEEENDEW
jgi:hypothetical protein